MYQAKPKLTRRQWGRSPLPTGAIPMGVIDSIKGVIWVPSSQRWWIAIGGVVSGCDQKEIQREVLQGIRKTLGNKAHEVAGCSPRTWEGWEQGRQIPCEIILALHDAL